MTTDAGLGVEIDRHLTSWLSKGDVLPFKTGLFTSLLLALMGISICIVYALYCLLEEFIKPIFWAVLLGTVIFPLKFSMCKSFEKWLSKVESTKTPLLIAILTLPLQLTDSCLEKIIGSMFSKSNIILLLFYLLIWCFSRAGPFASCLSRVRALWSSLDVFVLYASSSKLRLLVIPYVICILVSIKILRKNLDKATVRLFSVPVWLVAICQVANLFGAYRTIVSVALALLLLCINLELFATEKSSSESGSEVARAKINYLQHVVGAAICVFFLKHNYVKVFFLLLYVCALLKKGADLIVQTGIISNTVEKLRLYFKSGTISIVYNVWFPHQMRQFLHSCFYGTPQIFQKLRTSSSVLCSVLLMALMTLGLLVLSLFLVFQIADEVASMTMLTSDLIHKTWSNGTSVPEVMQKAYPVVGSSGVLESAYENVRAWLSSKLRDAMVNDSVERVEAVEAQLIRLLDELYKSFKDGQSKLATANGESMVNIWNRLWSHEFRALTESLIEIFQANMAIMSTILQTVWTMVVANLSAVLSFAMPMIWELFTFGFGLVNFLLKIVMFATTLNFLLVSSETNWLPADLFAWLLPFLEQSDNGHSVLFDALNRSIKSVFVITINMSVFYGLYTWLLCSLFGLSMTVIPSICAAIFATVPVMPPWCVCIFGVVELWLVNGETALAILLFLCFVLPQTVVDETFYAELNDTHPYMTGLAICGGVCWLGLEGAIIGPIILCCFLMMATLYRTFGKSIGNSQ